MIGGISLGFTNRLGERLADETVDTLHSSLARIRNAFQQFLASRANHKINIIFGIPVEDSDLVIEGAVEDADEAVLTKALESLPALYSMALEIIQVNPKNHFREVKFIYNPTTNEWEINYLVARKLEHVILGPRYYNAKHPLACKIENIRKRTQEMKFVSISLTGYKENK